MLWKVLTPFTVSEKIGWIPEQIKSEYHFFESVPATYNHDRSRSKTDARQWFDYFLHSFRAWEFSAKYGRKVGYLTAFPQLALCIGMLKRLTFSRCITVAWLFNMGSTPNGFKRQLARFGMRSVDLIVVHSRAEIAIYAEWLGLPPDRFCFVPLSISLEPYSGISIENEAFILSMGTANRDYETLFAAIEPLHIKTVVVAGLSAIKGLTIPSCVEVRTELSLSDCHALCRAARINVIPIKDVKNSSGQVTLLETMVQGKAVIATECAGTRDYVTSDVTGLLVPVRDALALRSAISRLWDDEEVRNRLGSAGAAYIASTSTFNAVSSQMEALLSSLVERPPVSFPSKVG